MFYKKLFEIHKNTSSIPNLNKVIDASDNLLNLLFPERCSKVYDTESDLTDEFENIKMELISLVKKVTPLLNESSTSIVNNLFNKIPYIYDKIRGDATAILNNDPAARDELEVIKTYPGFYAIAIYRLANEFYKLNIPYIPRILTEYAHRKTGIDIHPGATIGNMFCIDHGTGIVIGESCVIGNNVKIFQNVTLGALSVSKDMTNTKRHPTIGDNVVIYSGATILGGDTVIGENTVIGGNVWLVKSVPANIKVYNRSEFVIK